MFLVLFGKCHRCTEYLCTKPDLTYGRNAFYKVTSPPCHPSPLSCPSSSCTHYLFTPSPHVLSSVAAVTCHRGKRSQRRAHSGSCPVHTLHLCLPCSACSASRTWKRSPSSGPWPWIPAPASLTFSETFSLT